MTTITEDRNGPAAAPAASPVERGYLAPRVNIVETQDSFVVQAELPGVTREGIDLRLEGNELTLVGRRQSEVTNATSVYRESNARDFRREFALNPSIDSSRISASIEQGLLTVLLPKAGQVKPRKITVSG